MLRRCTFFAVFLFAACPGWSATLIVPGTGDGQEMLRDVAAVFSAANPPNVVAIPPSIGSEGGKLAVLEDRTKVARIAVPLTAAEEAQGILAVPILRVPTAIFAHPSVRVSELTSAQVADIFSGKIKNWKDVGGADLRVKVVRRQETDSTLQVLRSTMPGWKDLKITGYSKLLTTTQDALDTVRGIEGGVSFGPYSKSIEHEVRVFLVDGEHPCSPAYPSFTTIRLIYKRDHLDKMANDFIEFVRSEQALQIFIRHGGLPERP